MTANEHLRTKEEEAFMEHLRKTPFTDADMDLLTTAERWMDDGITSLPFGSWHDIFREVSEEDAVKVTDAGYCLARALSLLHKCDTSITIDQDQQLAKGAMHLYLAEAQRLFGAIFPNDHGFWQLFYSRLSMFIQDSLGISESQIRRKYALLYLPADALHSLSHEKYQLEYELLLQSIGAMITAVFAPGDADQRKTSLNHALRLTHRLEMQGYDAWITSIFHTTQNNPS